MGPGICVSDEELKAFALGQLDDSESEVIAAHVSDCPKCEETLSGFDDTNDSVLDAIRKVSTTVAGPEDAAPDADLLRQIENPWTDVEEGKPHKPMGERIRDYELIERLGAGGMGTVYKAVHCRLDRIVALKTLPNRRLRDAAAVSRFHREMKAIGRLDHPAIVRASDAGDDDGTHFIAMDFVDGIDLSQLVKLHGPIDVASACEIIRQAALGLQYAHEQGLIHRDVKPSNLMLTMTQPNVASVKLLDLGLALFGAASEAVDELTTVGQLMGTLDYMAPEQADNSHDVDARADVYSLGATLFKLLTGTAPYETSERLSPLRKMKALATVDAPSIATRRDDLLSEVVAITDRMLLRDPAVRFATAKDVAEAVAPLCNGHRLAELTQEGMRLRLELKNAPRTEKAEERIGQAVRDDGWPGLEGDSPKPRGFLRSAQSGPGHPDALESRRHSPSDAARKLRAPAFVTRRVTATLIATMLAVLAFGFIIRLRTDTGTLVIECDSADVPIEIRQGTGTVKTLTVSNGANELTLRSGTYEIVLPKDIDSLTVDAGKVELRRGEKSIVKITEIVNSEPKRATASTIGEAPVNEIDASSAAIDLPLGDVSKIIHDPVQQVEFARLRQRYGELLKKIDSLRDSYQQLVPKFGSDHPSVRAIEKDLLDALASSESTKADMQKMLNEQRELDRQRILDGELLAMQSSPQTASTEPVFEGKTFEQWKHLIETERSTSELVKAVDALGVLGKGTHDHAVVMTILKVIEQRPYAHPYQRGDIDAQFTEAAVRSLRAVDPKIAARLITSGFAVRAPSVQEFILAGVLGLPQELQHGQNGNTSQVTLGPYEPLKNALCDSYVFSQELCDLYEAKDGQWKLPEYTVFGQASAPLPTNSWEFVDLDDVGSTITFYLIGTHICRTKVSPRILAFLRERIGDPTNDPENPHLLSVSRAATLLLAKVSPDESLAQIFVRAIEENLRNPDANLPAGLMGGGFFSDVARGESALLPVPRQANAWIGLAVLGKHAEPAVPLLLRILSREGRDGDDANLLKRLITKYDMTTLLYLDGPNDYQADTLNMRLLAVEIIARSGTNNPQAIERLRDEFQSVLGQMPVADGSFEIMPGRNKYYLSLPSDSVNLKQFVFYDISVQNPKSPFEINMANSCLLAWKALTGEPPRFATDSLGDLATREWPEGTTTVNMPKVVKRDP